MTQGVFSGVGRILAIGDLHGNHAGFKRILRESGILDARGHWCAWDTHLVQLGDILGRGGEPGKIFKLLKRLETEATAFGSRVHVLLGNHEAMSMSGLIVYNTLEEFRDLSDQDLLGQGGQGAQRTPSSESESGNDAERPSSWDGADAGDGEAAASKPASPESKYGKRLDMLGAREFRASLSPGGKVGSWLLGHDSAVSINGQLFVHAGLNREHGFMPLEELNDRVRNELSDGGTRRAGQDVMLRRDGPQWNRDFTLRASDDRGSELREVLDYHGCERMVVGHTPTSVIDRSQPGRILPLYGEQLYCIDTGIGKTYGENLSALNLERGAASALYF
ncbi:MAG: metallophosphoesterase [Fibrobacteria bacterium]